MTPNTRRTNAARITTSGRDSWSYDRDQRARYSASLPIARDTMTRAKIVAALSRATLRDVLAVLCVLVVVVTLVLA